MGMTVKRRKDQAVPRVFEHKVADISGGVSVKTSELGGDFLFGKSSPKICEYAIIRERRKPPIFRASIYRPNCIR